MLYNLSYRKKDSIKELLGYLLNVLTFVNKSTCVLGLFLFL